MKTTREKNNPAKPCLDFRIMCQFKWIIMKEIFGVQSTKQVLCFWQPLLACLPIISLHVSENRHDSTGKALIKSSRMLFMLAVRGSKWLLWCSQWSLSAVLEKCPIKSENFLPQNVCHPCKPWCTFHTSCDLLVTPSALTCVLTTAS